MAHCIGDRDRAAVSPLPAIVPSTRIDIGQIGIGERRAGIALARRASSWRISSAAASTACALEAAIQEPPSTGACGKLEVGKLDADVLDRQPERIGRDLRHDGVGAGADVGSRAGHLGMAIGGQHDTDCDRHLQRFPHACRHAPADQLLAVAHRAGRRIASAPAKGFRPAGIAFAQLLAGVGQVFALVAIRIALQPQFDRVELERDRQLVHGAFERADAGSRARRAHVAGRGDVETDELVGEAAVRALVELFRPAGVVARKVLVARGDGRGLVRDRIERAVGLCAESDALDRRGPVAEPVHLLPRQHDANGALQRERAKRCQHHLVLRPQAGAEGAADIGRDHADVIGLLAEHAA